MIDYKTKEEPRDAEEDAKDQAFHDFILAAKVFHRTRFEFESAFKDLDCDPLFKLEYPSDNDWGIQAAVNIAEAKHKRFEFWFREVGRGRAAARGKAV